MTAGQTRVFMLLLATLGLEAIFSPGVKGIFMGNVPNVPGAMGALVADAVAVLLLIALAAPAPQLATIVAVILLLLVLFAHSAELVGIVNGATAVNKSLAHQGA